VKIDTNYIATTEKKPVQMNEASTIVNYNMPLTLLLQLCAVKGLTT